MEPASQLSESPSSLLPITPDGPGAEPLPINPTPALLPLRKCFRVTGDTPMSFSKAEPRVKLFPHISLLLLPPKTPAQPAAAQIAQSQDFDQTQAELEAHRKGIYAKKYSARDIPFLVEIKLRGLDGSSTLRLAEYIRALKYEQHDRSFLFSATMSNDEFRL